MTFNNSLIQFKIFIDTLPPLPYFCCFVSAVTAGSILTGCSYFIKSSQTKAGNGLIKFQNGI